MITKLKGAVSLLHSTQNLLTFYCSSSESQTKRKVWEKALLSLNVINTILKTPSFNDLKLQSLTERILKGIQNEKDVSAESKKQISSIFTEGVEIDTSIFSQQRITSEEIQYKLNKKTQSLRNFTFYPTYLVTSQIFKRIVRLGNQKTILIGNYGISKTVSVSLFWKLTQYIDKYRFQQGLDAKDEKFFQVPKIVYWTIEEKDTLQKVEQLILKQCPEINIDSKLKNFTSMQIKLSYLYQKLHKKTKLMIVVDQIQFVASQQSIISSLKQKQTNNELSESEKKYLMKLQKTIWNFKWIFSHILPSFNGIRYLSHMDVQYNFLRGFDLSANNQHQLAKKKLTQYSTKIFEEQSMLELVNFFFFEFEQRIMKQSQIKMFDPQIKRDLLQKCFDYLKKKQFNYFFTLLDIREHIEVMDKYKKLEKLSENNLFQKVFQSFKSMVDNSTQNYRNILQYTPLRQKYYIYDIVFNHVLY